MAEDISRVLGNPLEIILQGETYKLSPLQVSDLAAAEAHMKDQELQAFLAHAGDVSESVQTHVILDIIQKPQGMNRVFDAIGSMAGIQFLLWTSLCKNHPELTRDKVGSMVTFENIKRIRTILLELDENAEADEEGTDEAKKAMAG